jgi:hypothetical protein
VVLNVIPVSSNCFGSLTMLLEECQSTLRNIPSEKTSLV